MNFFFVLLSVIASNQLCYGAAEMRSLGPLDTRTRQMYSHQGLPDFPNLADDENREVYSYEQTIVVKVAGPTGRVHHCQVIEVYKEDEAAEASRELEFILKLKVQKTDMERMMSLLADCDSVDEWGIEEETDEDSSEKPDSPNAIINGIFPGTKWCGLGDISHGYHDLGKLHDVDRCCRSHDLCPIKVFKKDTRYNITNKSRYTKSHCLCDQVFYDCLKEDNGWTAKFIGKLYFDVASPQCVKGVPENPAKKMEFIPAPNKWKKYVFESRKSYFIAHLRPKD